MSDTDHEPTSRDTRSNSKVFVHVPPRIDQEYYQVELPYVYHGPRPVEAIQANWIHGTHEVHSTQHDEVKKNFLLFTRNIFERSYHSNNLWTKENSRSTSLHTDEHALEFLALHNYEINKAKFFLCAQLSGGKEIQHVRKIRHRLTHLTSSTNKITDKLQILFHTNEVKNIHGFYSSSAEDSTQQRVYTIEMTTASSTVDQQETDHSEIVAPDEPTPAPAPAPTSSSSKRNKKKTSASNGYDTPPLPPPEVEDADHHDPNDKHRSKADKQDRKKKWLAILKTLTNLQNSMNPGAGYSRPTYDSLNECMELAYRNLPAPSDIVLGDTAEHNLQEVFHFLLEKYLICKEWIADVYDAFARCRNDSVDFKKLQSLLNEGERLSFRCVLEETQLRRSFRDLERIADDGEGLLERINQPHPGSPKIPLSELNDFLVSIKPYGSITNVLSPSDIKSLHDLYEKTVELNESTEFIIHRAAMPRIKRVRLTRVTVNEINEQLSKIAAHPVDIFGAEDIKAIKEVGASWQVEASSVCAEGAPLVSMTKLETLISRGEKLPLDFPEELDILRNKRIQAKQWLEKFGKSVSATTSSRHTRKSEGRAGANGGLPLMNVSLGEKINLVDMKKMVQQGEQLCEERKSKELTRAMNVLDTAEEWIDRVKEFLASGVSSDIESLQELLEETEGMPVAMVEADLLRSHIEALQWAERARPILEKEKMKLSSLQRLSRDISKIRGMIAADYNEQLAVTLPEESQLSDILNSYQRWQEATKKLFHLGALKSGVTLETLQTFLAECDAMPMELESESKQIRSIVSEASEWIQSFSGVLQALRIPITSISIAPSPPPPPPPPPPAAAATTTEGGDGALEANENETNEKTTKTETEEETEIGYSELKILIDAAHNVTIHFPELIAARKRWADVQEWLDTVDAKCPKRHGKKSRHSSASNIPSVQTSDLMELVQAAQELHVAFPDELKRLEEVIDRSMTWELNCEKNIIDIMTFVEAVVSSCQEGLGNLPQLLTKFNFLIGTHQQLDYSQYTAADIGELTEEETTLLFHLPNSNPLITPSSTSSGHPGHGGEAPWDFVEKQLVPMIEILIRGGEEAGSITTQGLLILACHKVFNWITFAKSKLTSGDWGNATRNEILSLIDEARLAVKLERSVEEFDQFYQNSLLSSSIPQQLSTDLDLRSNGMELPPPPPLPEVASTVSEQVTPQPPKKRGRKKEIKAEVELQEEEANEENQSEVGGDLNESGGGRKKRVGKGVRGKRSFFGDEDVSSVDEVAITSKSTPAANKKRVRGSGAAEEMAVPASGTAKKKPRASKGEAAAVLQDNEGSSADAAEASKEQSSVPTAAYFDLSNPHTTNFPLPIVRLIDLWIRWLVIFVKRLDEIEIWKKHSCQIIANSHSHNRKSGGVIKTPKKMNTRDHSGHDQISAKDWHSVVLRPEDESAVVKLLDWAKRRNLSCSTRKVIERRYQCSLDWQKKVTDVLTVVSCRVSLEDTQAILKESDDSLLIVYPELIQSLKDQIKRAKAWIQKLEKTVDSGGTSGSSSIPISTKELEEIMPETETICIDLTTQINNLLQHTKVYCLCREGNHGMMLGCEKCDDWYHTTCLGYTKIQADRIDTYICLRCLIVSSFNGTFTQVSAIVNSWMTPEDAVTLLESKRQKVLKRVHKEEKDILKLNEDLVSITQTKLVQQQQVDQILSTPVTTSNTTSADSHSNTQLTPTPTPSQPVTLAHQLPLDTSFVISNLEKKEHTLRTEIESLLLKLARIKAEEEELLSYFTLTLQQRYQLNDWMMSLQCLLWPKTPEEVEYGRPLLTGLPVGIIHAIDQANKFGLEKVHDVRVIVDGFRWMTWCFQCLTILRLPPTSKQLKKLLDAAANCRFADDKVLKIIYGISQRATQWKVKARKFLGVSGPPSYKGHQYSTKPIDVIKAKAILLEGNLSPLRSRLKDLLRELIAQSEAGNSRETSGTGRQRKAALESVVGSGGLQNLSSAHGNSTSASSSAAAAMVTLDEYPPYSSDEDENGDSSSSTSKARSKREYSSYSTLQFAPPMDNIWPPKQTIPRSVFRMYSPSYRHIFLTASSSSLASREEISSSSSYAAPSASTSVSVALSDSLTIANELTKKRKLSEAAAAGGGTEASGGEATQAHSISMNQTRGIETTTKPGAAPKSTLPTAPAPAPVPSYQSVKTTLPPRGHFPRPSYHAFPPRPLGFPPGSLVRGGMLAVSGPVRPIHFPSSRPPAPAQSYQLDHIPRAAPSTSAAEPTPRHPPSSAGASNAMSESSPRAPTTDPSPKH